MQKHKTKKSAIEDEIKRIELNNHKHKSLNELKGGNKDNEFFCTYSNLNMGISRVYSEHCTKAPQLISDFPINMAVSEQTLRKNAHALP